MSEVFSAVDSHAMQAGLTQVLQSTDINEVLRPNGRLKSLQVGALGGRIWKLIQDALANIDLSSMTKEEFLDKVDDLYDTMIAPAIIGINPLIGPLLNAALNQIILNIAGKFYDNHSGPKPTPASSTVSSTVAGLIVFALAMIFGSTANAQCIKDPLTGQMRCQPIKAAVSTTAAVVGKTVSAVGAAITPDYVPLPAQYGQTYSILELPVSHSPVVVQSTPVQSQVATSIQSSPICSTQSSSYSGWSKSWHKVHGQPARNVGRRLLGK